MLYVKNSESEKIKALEFIEIDGFIGSYLSVTFDKEPSDCISPVGFKRTILVKDKKQLPNGNWSCMLYSKIDSIEEILLDLILLKEFVSSECGCEHGH